MIPIVTGAIGLATAITIMVLIRRDHLHVRNGLWWVAAAIVFALLGFFPAIFDHIAQDLGIAYPPVLALMLAAIILVIKILVMDIERSRNAIKLQRLIQRVAMLETDLRTLQSEISESDPSPKEDD